MSRQTFILLASLFLVLPIGGCGESYCVSPLVDSSGAVGKLRVGVERGPAQIGGVGTYYGQSESSVWGAGAYAQIAIDPETQTPVAEQLAQLTALLQSWGCPIGQPYIVLEATFKDYTEDAGLSLTPAIGLPIAEVLIVEYGYDWTDGGAMAGSNSEPALGSGARLSFGALLEF